MPASTTFPVAAWLGIQVLRGQVASNRLERWQTSYLPLFDFT